MSINQFPQPTSDAGAVASVNTQIGAVVLTSADVGAEPVDASILKSANIGVSVEGFDATILKSAGIGVSVQAYDAGLTTWAAIAPSTKQETLVSTTNIKTINGTTVLGSGNLVVSGAGSPMATTIIDLGASPVSNASVTITNASISATSYIQVFVMGDATADNNIDAHLHAGASWKFITVPATGSFTLYIDALIDLCWGTFSIRYTYA